MLAFRHGDPRFPFLWQTAAQPAGRWHAEGEGPANYFADTPIGAWAEFVRHEEITDAADLAGVERSLWVVELPDDIDLAEPDVADATLRGGVPTYPDCQRAARRLRADGATALRAPSAALPLGGGAGWHARPSLPETRGPERPAWVWVLFGPCDAVGWPAVVRGAPPALLLPLVRAL